MTHQMRDDQVDGQIRDFLAWQAGETAGAPSATEMAARVSSGVGTRTLTPRLAPQLAWVLLAGLLVLALMGALLIGGSLLPTPPVRTSYEAVFLRLELLGDAPEVVVVGVNTQGRQREIARLPEAWVAYGIGEGSLAPMGAVSSTGLLAMPSNRGETGQPAPQMHWEIFDLHRPGADPIVVPGIRDFVEQLPTIPYFTPGMRPSVFWGPGDRVAIPWYDCIPDPNDARSCTPDYHLSFVEGRTGTTTPVDVPDPLWVLPQWAPDGSGVVIGDARNGIGDVVPSGVLLPDGTVTEEVPEGAEDSCRTSYRSGAEFTVTANALVRRNGDGSRDELLQLDDIGFACLAPDDSSIVYTIGPGSGRGTVNAAQPKGGLIASGSGASFEVEGNFAGWLEVSEPAISPPPDATVRPQAANGWIAYSTRSHNATTGVEGQIYLVREGAAPRLVAGDGAICPSFSPDGRKLSYVRDESVSIVEVDPSGEVREGQGFGLPGLVDGACPVWSPSGEAVAALASGEILVLGLDRSITSLAMPDMEPVAFAHNVLVWTPDGTAITYATDRGIWLRPVDRSPQRKLSSARALSLSWSPDGSRLAFYEEGNGPAGRASVLTIDGEDPVIVLGPGSRPVWSPTGESIAYRSDTGLVTVRADGSDWRVVSERAAYGFGGWSPDGQRLLEMLDVSGTDWDLISVAADATGTDTVIARQIDTGSARNFPDLGDVSWQPVAP